VLGIPADPAGYHDIDHFPDATQIPGLVIIRWDAPLIFANASLFRNKLRKMIAQTEPKPVWIVIAAEPINAMDTTASELDNFFYNSVRMLRTGRYVYNAHITIDKSLTASQAVLALIDLTRSNPWESLHEFRHRRG
jgi:MFS superfamily sulfate permease-like transporter